MSAVTYAALVEEAELSILEHDARTKVLRTPKYQTPDAVIALREARSNRKRSLLRLAEFVASHPAEIKAIMERESAEKVA